MHGLVAPNSHFFSQHTDTNALTLQFKFKTTFLSLWPMGWKKKKLHSYPVLQGWSNNRWAVFLSVCPLFLPFPSSDILKGALWLSKTTESTSGSDLNQCLLRPCQELLTSWRGTSVSSTTFLGLFGEDTREGLLSGCSLVLKPVPLPLQHGNTSFFRQVFKLWVTSGILVFTYFYIVCKLIFKILIHACL